jgi:hypothetical protein
MLDCATKTDQGGAMRRFLILVPIFLLILNGCSPAQFNVAKIGSSNLNAPGFRYFLPRPYLLITNMAVAPAPATTPANPTTPKPTGGGTGGTGGAGGSTGDKDAGANPPGATSQTAVSTVTLQLIWLPDFDQEYAISIKGGRTGTFNGGIQLSNGWMLTGVNEQNDSGTAQTLTAVSGFLGTLLSASGLPVGAKSTGTVEVVQVQVPQQPFLLLFRIDDNKTLEVVDTCALTNQLKKVFSVTAPTGYTPGCVQ